jgi:hypothetical protein
VYPFDEPEEDVDDEDDVVDLEELSMAASWAFIYAPSFRIIKDGLIGYYVSQSGDEKQRMMRRRMYREYVPLRTVRYHSSTLLEPFIGVGATSPQHFAHLFW